MGSTTDLINGSQIVSVIASSTTGYLANFSPLIYLGGGILLAVGISYFLIDILSSVRTPNIPEFDYQKADSLARFYSRRGRNSSSYDWDSNDFDDTIDW